jgi:hypothetical protein
LAYIFICEAELINKKKEKVIFPNFVHSVCLFLEVGNRIRGDLAALQRVQVNVLLQVTEDSEVQNVIVSLKEREEKNILSVLE